MIGKYKREKNVQKAVATRLHIGGELRNEERNLPKLKHKTKLTIDTHSEFQNKKKKLY